MKYEKDKITAIIPVYNVENYLERCLLRRLRRENPRRQDCGKSTVEHGR